MADLLYSQGGIEAWHADWRALAEIVRASGGCDTIAHDAPYSAKTHVGHDDGDRYDGSGVARGDAEYGHRKKTRGINYAPWTSTDVQSFVEAWSPICRGWMATITDHVLATAWRESFESVGRYAFAPIPIVEIGSRVRLVGDGPSSWTCYLIVARPSDGAWLTEWRRGRRSRGEGCALPGGYVYTGHGDRVVMGGKRTDTMVDIVRDYSAPGDRVVDPTAGGFTTGVACKLTGRLFVGGDVMREHCDIGVERLRDMPTADRDGTLALFGRSA